MAHIIVIGAGIGGVPCAFELRKKLGKDHRMTLVGSAPYFEFTPSNPWIAVGRRKCEQTRVAIRLRVREPRATMIGGVLRAAPRKWTAANLRDVVHCR